MIDLGKIIKPQGIKGEVKVEPISDPEFFLKLDSVVIDDNIYTLQSASVRGGFAYLKLNGIDSIDAAENLRGKVLKVEKDKLPALDEGKFFYEDLVDCKLYTKDDKYIGEIVGLQNYGSSDLLEIHGVNQFGSSLCPYVVGLFAHVDIENKKIIVNEKKFKELTDYED